LQAQKVILIKMSEERLQFVSLAAGHPFESAPEDLVIGQRRVSVLHHDLRGLDE